MAEPAIKAPGAPKYSDVCFSPRWRRPRGANDPYETFRDAQVFHATRFDWVYSTDAEWIAECKKHGYRFTGTLNTILVDTPGATTREKGRILDKDGNRIAAPWMRNWSSPGYWGCANSPEYRETFLSHAKIMIDGGADALQMDDPVINIGATKWGGCFCQYCIRKASEKGLSLPEDMKSLQSSSVREFFTDLRKEIDGYAGRKIPWSSNNYGGRTGFPYNLFDYGTAELPFASAKPEELYRQFASTARSGRQQIYTFVSANLLMTRRLIATAYGCGGHIIVPYDVYNGDRPRIFGKPEEYADLYGFVRSMKAYLDGFEDAAAFGKGIEDTRYPSVTPLSTENDSIYAFVRAQPGRTSESVVVHLIDWRKDPKPFVLTIKSDYIFRRKKFRTAIFVPSAFDNDTHLKASKKKDYSSLRLKIKAQTEVNEQMTKVHIPALNPWGMVILDPRR